MGSARRRPCDEKAETTTSRRATKMHYRDRGREGRSQCTCIACATRIDQSFANYARDFFLPWWPSVGEANDPVANGPAGRDGNAHSSASILLSSSPSGRPREGGTSDRSTETKLRSWNKVDVKKEKRRKEEVGNVSRSSEEACAEKVRRGRKVR